MFEVVEKAAPGSLPVHKMKISKSSGEAEFDIMPLTHPVWQEALFCYMGRLPHWGRTQGPALTPSRLAVVAHVPLAPLGQNPRGCTALFPSRFGVVAYEFLAPLQRRKRPMDGRPQSTWGEGKPLDSAP